MVSNDRPPVKATTTSFTILEAIRDRNGSNVTELARHVDLSKSAVYKHLTTLTQLGYLVKEGTTYHLSLSFRGLSARACERHPIHSAEPAIDNLARTTGELANFMIYENGYGIYAYQAHSDADEPPLPAFSHVPLHATAGGKTILAYLPAEKRETVLHEVGLRSITEKTITDQDTLQQELQSVRDRRVAFDREEFATGYQCVGSPIIDSNGHPIGAVSVSGTIQEMTGKRLEEDITGLVVSTARSIENDARSI
jgi:DNA-binding IclR family transcriptional regulator